MPDRRLLIRVFTITFIPKGLWTLHRIILKDIKNGSALTYAADYKGKLYLTHGDMDDNVHLQNSIYLISRLQDEGKVFEFMLYPGGRHGWGGAKATHLRNEEYNFWLRNFFKTNKDFY